MTCQIVAGDVEEVLSRIPDNTFSGVLCDPPYGLSFMNKRWDYDVPSVARWASVFRAMRPGAPLLAFGGTRTYHRMIVNIEDAGFEIRDCLMWIYGSGFPKSLNLHDEWQGYGTALKPAYEPILLARKPLEGTVAQNVTRWGCGALAIDACRIDKAEGDTNGWDAWDDPGSANTAMSGGNTSRTAEEKAKRTNPPGRWPANVIMDADAGAVLDAQTGNRPGMSGGGKHRADYPGGMFGGIDSTATARGDSGGASRFFYCPKVSTKERNAGCEALPAMSGGEATDRKDGSAGLANPRAGAGRGGGNKNNHPTLKPLALTEYLARLILPPVPGVLLVPFAGSGSEMIGAHLAGWTDVLGIERDPDYVRIAEHRLAHYTS